MRRLRWFVVMVVGLLLVALPGYAGELTIRPNSSCRLYDSRVIHGGPKLSSATVATWGAPGPLQGGQSGCGIPATAVAAVVNLTIYLPDSAGFSRLWAAGTQEPLSTVVAYADEQLIIVNSVHTDLNLNGEFAIQNRDNTGAAVLAHMIVDLVGWVDGPGNGVGYGGTEAPNYFRVLTVQNAPFAPGATAKGNRHIVDPNGATGVYAGHEGEITYWDGANWVFEKPVDGDLAYISATGRIWRYGVSLGGWAQLAED